MTLKKAMATTILTKNYCGRRILLLYRVAISIYLEMQIMHYKNIR